MCNFGRSFLFNISNFQNKFQTWCCQIETTKYFLQYRHNPVDDDNTPGGIFSPWLGFGLLVLGRLHTNQRSRDSKEKSLHFYHCFTFISCLILFVLLQEILAYISKEQKKQMRLFSVRMIAHKSAAGSGFKGKTFSLPTSYLGWDFRRFCFFRILQPTRKGDNRTPYDQFFRTKNPFKAF